jgi:hypothetical protein
VAERNGVLSVCDAKNGPNARFTKNQKKRGGSNSVETAGGTFVGKNARKAQIAGKRLGATPVNIAGYGNYKFCGR